jgi:hypothetical protein
MSHQLLMAMIFPYLEEGRSSPARQLIGDPAIGFYASPQA